jgi:hypothetical protein
VQNSLKAHCMKRLNKHGFENWNIVCLAPGKLPYFLD